MENFKKLLSKKRERGNLYFHDIFPYYRQITSISDSLLVNSSTQQFGVVKTIYTTQQMGAPPVASRIKILSSHNEQTYIHLILNPSITDGSITMFTPYQPYNNSNPTGSKISIYYSGVRIFNPSNVYAQLVTTNMWTTSGPIFFTLRKNENDQYEFSTDDKTFYNVNQMLGRSPTLINSLLDTNLHLLMEVQSSTNQAVSVSWSSEPKTA